MNLISFSFLSKIFLHFSLDFPSIFSHLNYEKIFPLFYKQNLFFHKIIGKIEKILDKFTI